MIEFLAMSGYAAYVWPSVALTLALMLANVVWAKQLAREAKAEALRRIASQDAT